MIDTLQAGDDWAMDLLSCRQCHADLTQLPRRAKFCPRCGVQFLNEDPLPIPVEPIPDGTVTSPIFDPVPPSPEQMLQQVEEWRQLRQSLQQQNPGDAIEHDSDVLRGFANAMFHLGRRYESGLGASRNVDEAIRCYFKSARLGNVDAISRLTPQCALPANTPTTHDE